MKRKLFAIAAVVTVLAALIVAGLAFAQGNRPPNEPGVPYGMMGGYGYGMLSGYGYGPMHEYMLPAYAEALGMTPEELQARLEGGETMWDVARAQGLSDEEVYDLMEEAHEKALDQAVEAGALSQKQADWMDKHMDQMVGSGFAPGGCHGAGGVFTGQRQTSRSGRSINQGWMAGMMGW